MSFTMTISSGLCSPCSQSPLARVGPSEYSAPSIPLELGWACPDWGGWVNNWLQPGRAERETAG